jgi:hypothetical protein
MPRSIFDSVSSQPVASEGATGSRRRSIFDGAAPPPQEEPGMVGKAISTVGSYIPQPVKTTVGTVLDILGRPGAATAGFIGGALDDGPGLSDVVLGKERPGAFKRAWQNLTGERRDDFDQVLEEQGFEDSFARKAAGFVGDVVVDPLNLVGVGAVKTVAKAGTKAIATPLAKGLAAADKATGGIGKAIVDDLGQKFVPRYGLEVSATEAATLGKVGKTVEPGKGVADEFHKFTKERSTIPARMEHKAIEDFKQFPDADVRKTIQDDLHAGAGSTPEIDDFIQQQHKRQDEMFKRETDALVQKPESYNPDYGAYQDFTTKIQQGKPIPGTGPSSALSAKLGPARHRKFENWDDAKAAGAEQDSAVSWFHRLVKSEKAILTSQHAQNMAAKYGIKVEDLAGLDPSDITTFRKLERFPAEEPLRKHLEEYVFPEKIAAALDAQFTPGKAQGALGRIYDKAMAAWRTQATILRPGFHGTNLQGNVFNAWLGGQQIHPGRYVEAIASMRGKGPAKIGNYTRDEIEDYMTRFGVAGADHNFVTEMLGQGAEKQLKNKLAQVSGPTLKDRALHPIQTARTVGSSIEDASKRALFFDALHKGMSLDDAAKTVDKFLFDYADLTRFEKDVMKKIFPFYTWMRKNVPLQAEQLVKQPHKYAAVEKTRNAIERETEDRGSLLPDALRPEYLQETGAVQLPTDKGENKKFWTPYLPYQDLDKLSIPGGTSPLDASREVGSGVNPVLKTAIELLTNKSLFMNKPLYDSELGMMGDTQKISPTLDMLPEFVKRQLFSEVQGPNGPQFETPAAVKYALQNILPFTEGVGKAAQAVTRPEDAANPSAAAGWLTGVRVNELNPQQERATRKAALSEAKRIGNKKAKQERKPASKAKVDSLYEKYLSGR